MEKEKSYTSLTWIGLSLFALFIMSLLMLMINTKIPADCVFYDGEGNVIPSDVVHLEVKSHFVVLTRREMDSLDRYFYFDTIR